MSLLALSRIEHDFCKWNLLDLSFFAVDPQNPAPASKLAEALFKTHFFVLGEQHTLSSSSRIFLASFSYLSYTFFRHRRTAWNVADTAGNFFQPTFDKHLRGGQLGANGGVHPGAAAGLRGPDGHAADRGRKPRLLRDHGAEGVRGLHGPQVPRLAEVMTVRVGGACMHLWVVRVCFGICKFLQRFAEM